MQVVEKTLAKFVFRYTPKFSVSIKTVLQQNYDSITQSTNHKKLQCSEINVRRPQNAVYY